MTLVSTGKRAAARKSARPRPTLNLAALVYALAITVCVVAWGYLVYLAIDFGAAGRSGESGAWGLLLLASLGAVACLFAGLLFIARLLQALGITKAPEVEEEEAPPRSSRPTGGRRAAR